MLDLRLYTPKLVRTILLINSYLNDTGRDSFTYRQLQRYWERSDYKDLHWHTVERNIRKLVNMELLQKRLVKSRYYDKKIAVFYPTGFFYSFIEEYQETRKKVMDKARLV